MVEITNKTRQVVYFPKTYAGSTTSLNLHLHSELSQKDWFFDVQDLASLKDYYKFSVDFTAVDDGEFNYYVKADDDALDSGLIRIGVSQSNNGQYGDDGIEIVQYDMYAEPTPPTPSGYTVFFDSKGGEKELTVRLDGDWHISGDTYFYINPMSGTGEQTITVSAGTYPACSCTGTGETSTVNIVNESGKAIPLSIHQGSNDLYLGQLHLNILGVTGGTYDGSYIHFPSTGGSYTIEFYFEVKDRGTRDDFRGPSAFRTTFTEIENPEDDKVWTYTAQVSGFSMDEWDGNRPGSREVEFIYHPCKECTSYHYGYYAVSVALIPRPELRVETDLPGYVYGNPNVPATGGTYTFTVNSTMDWTGNTVNLTTSAYNITLSQSSGESGTTVVTATIPENTDNNENNFVIEFGIPNATQHGDIPVYASFYVVQGATPAPSGATAITLNVPSVIIGEGKATVTVEPSGAVVDLYFSADESSPTEAAIDQEGNIYVLANGVTTICVEDLNSGLKDCKEITCVLEPSEIYVQTLIDEGYANVVTGAGGTYIEIQESCPYSAAEILDLGEVARNEKKLSGDTNNVILWDQPLPNGWTNSDITSIYSGKTLNFTPRARMYWALGDVDSFEVTFAGGSYQVNDYPWGSGGNNNGVFAPRYNSATGPDYFWKSPKNLTVNFTDTYGTVCQTMFAEMQTTTAVTINVNGFFSCVDWTGWFEDCYNLETLTLNGMFRYDFTRLCHNMFKNCEKLQSVPYVVAWGRDHIQNTVRPHTQPGGSADAGGMFQNCPALQSIGLTLDFECISLSGCVVDGETQVALSAPMVQCANLTDVRIKNLGHNSWDFANANGKVYIPKMDVASIEYILNNVQDETGNGYTLTFSTLHQGQISTAAISNAQNKGWTIAWE